MYKMYYIMQQYYCYLPHHIDWAIIVNISCFYGLNEEIKD
jgi:hypothetical protein